MVRAHSHSQPHDEESPRQGGVRSIRNLRPSAERVRLSPRGSEASHEFSIEDKPRSRMGIWILATISLIIVAGIAALIFLSPSVITLVPYTHVIPFDASTPLTAYPSTSAAPGTIVYSVNTQVFEDSAVVAASGTEHVDEKATGNITIYNETDKPARLIKNTRFQTPAGLIFRIPASVDVPAKVGTTPGSISVTIFADQTGPTYNIPPTDKFTLPGLKSSPDMFAKVYGKSTAAFTGGFSGDRPAVSPSVLDTARAEVRGRLSEKANALSETAPDGSVAFPGLMAVSFETLPPTNEPGGGVRIHERASVAMPVFAHDAFAHAVAQAVSADAEGESVDIRFSDDVAGQPVGGLAAADLGSQPITFTLTGRGQLVWNIDRIAVRDALAGREESAFETIVKGFRSIEEARARITPFWSSSFPKNADSIKVVVEEPDEQF